MQIFPSEDSDYSLSNLGLEDSTMEEEETDGKVTGKKCCEDKNWEENMHKN